MVEFEVSDDGIATITWNVADRPMNVLNDVSIAQFEECVDRALSESAIKGAIITSSRPEFLVGADLDTLRGVSDPALAMKLAGGLSALLRRMERGGKPIVAAINGSALGGGLEVCLASHRRIAADNPKTQLGLPEVTLGLLPGAGGTQRLPRMIGLQRALPLLLEGRTLDVATALELGLVDEVVPADQLLVRARQWLLAASPADAVQPWDRKGFKIPGGGPQTAGGRQMFMVAVGGLRAKTAGLYPAPTEILTCLHDGCNVDIDAGLKIEGRRFAKLAISPTAQNMIRTLFYAIGDANRLASRPAGVQRQKFARVGVLGAGMMGHGIAHVAAKSGLEVVLLDASAEAAEAGRAKALAPFDRQVKQGRMAPEEFERIAGRVKATSNFADLAGADIVVEAVFENRAIKADVTVKTEAVLAPGAIFASNTSTLPITGLAEASRRPKNFIGLHFFSPVERMQLVEVIRGRETSEETVARAMDFVKQIRKTPIVVNDGRGFYTSRVFGTYVYEGMALLADGVVPSVIDRAGTNCGMPVGPLALMDEVSIELMLKVMRQTQADLGPAYQQQPQDPVLVKMVEQLGRLGRKSGGGFYDYAQDGTKRLWPELGRHFPLAVEQPDFDDVQKRLMYIQSLEAARCLEENIIDASNADVGSILGWGFPPALGGVVSQIDTVGLARFIEECDRLAQRYGARFMPPRILRERAVKEKLFRAA